MLTMDWKDLQYRKPKPIKKKVKQKKGSQVVSVKYPIGKTSFSASNWEEYQQWIKQQKKTQLLQEKASKALNKSKGKTVKAKGKKAVKTPKNSLTRKEQYQLELKDKRWKDVSIKILKRDGFKCVLCGSSSELQVHHTKYHSDKKAWEYPNSTLVTLCKECHQKVHSDKTNELYPKYE